MKVPGERDVRVPHTHYEPEKLLVALDYRGPVEYLDSYGNVYIEPELTLETLTQALRRFRAKRGPWSE